MWILSFSIEKFHINYSSLVVSGIQLYQTIFVHLLIKLYIFQCSLLSHLAKNICLPLTIHRITAQQVKNKLSYQIQEWTCHYFMKKVLTFRSCNLLTHGLNKSLKNENFTVFRRLNRSDTPLQISLQMKVLLKV